MLSLSPSSLDTWLTCRLRWKYEQEGDVRIVNRDLLRGAAGHAALEAFYRAEPAHRSLALLEMNAVVYLASTPEPESEQEERAIEQAEADVLKALGCFWHKFGADAETQFSVEHRLERELVGGATSVHTVLDGLTETDVGFIIYEHKFPLYKQSLSDYVLWSPQHRIGAWALNTKRPVYVVYTLCATTGTERSAPVLIPPWQIAEAVEILSLAAFGMSVDPAQPHYSRFTCPRCPFRERCEMRLTGGEE